MSRPTSPAYYYFSEDFDYRSYLEERSHFDDVVLSIDRQTAAVVGSATEISNSIGASAYVLSDALDEGFGQVSSQLQEIEGALSNLNDGLVEGFENVCVRLNDIDESVQNLNSICQIGFTNLAASAARTNSLLETLIDRIETPDYVWAKEKIDAAEKCVNQKLWPEAIEFSTKAIEGDANNSGYSIEAKFYFFRGSIFIGAFQTDPKFVDADLARQDFENAAKYCPAENTMFKKVSLTHAGWCAYCTGSIKDAASLLLEAALIKETYPEAEYLLAKCNARIGKIDRLDTYLSYCFDHDPNFAIRALNDRDFFKHRDAVLELVSVARDKREEYLKNWRDKRFQVHPIRLLADSDYISDGEKDEIQRFEKLVEDIEQKPTFLSLFNLNISLVRSLGKVASIGANACQKMELEIQELRQAEITTSEFAPREIEHDGESVGMGGTSGALLGGLIGIPGAPVLTYLQGGAPNGLIEAFGFLLQSIGKLFISVPACAAAGWVLGMVIGAVVANKQYSDETALQDEEIRNHQEAIDSEKKQVDEAYSLACRVEATQAQINNQIVKMSVLQTVPM